VGEANYLLKVESQFNKAKKNRRRTYGMKMNNRVIASLP